MNWRYLMGWIFVRPRRWLFWNMISNYNLRLWPKREYEWEEKWWRQMAWPNLHWWILYKTVFKFCKWLHYDAWRPLCKWNTSLIHKPWYATLIHRIGATTAGFAIGGGECFHCASERGCPVELTHDPAHFELLETWTTQCCEGTDHRFRGITTCPDCGYQAEYEDGSL